MMQMSDKKLSSLEWVQPLIIIWFVTQKPPTNLTLWLTL